jgi:hypothetical protein
LGKRNQDWYVRLFARARAKGLVTGEITPAYATLDQEIWRRIQAMNDKIKLIFVMRDPVDRVWSSINNTAKKNRLNGELTMATALKRAHFGPTCARTTPTPSNVGHLYCRSSISSSMICATSQFAVACSDWNRRRRCSCPGGGKCGCSQQADTADFGREMAKTYLPRRAALQPSKATGKARATRGPAPGDASLQWLQEDELT